MPQRLAHETAFLFSHTQHCEDEREGGVSTLLTNIYLIFALGLWTDGYAQLVDRPDTGSERICKPFPTSSTARLRERGEARRGGDIGASCPGRVVGLMFSLENCRCRGLWTGDLPLACSFAFYIF